MLSFPISRRNLPIYGLGAIILFPFIGDRLFGGDVLLLCGEWFMVSSLIYRRGDVRHFAVSRALKAATNQYNIDLPPKEVGVSSRVCFNF